MGLANLVPGISGGTMLLASGIYPRFIESIAELSTLKFNKRAFAVLGLVGVAAALAILLLAGTVKTAVVDHRWAMYSVFIGLTLGGVPVIWQMARPVDRRFWIGAALGLAAMVWLAWLQMSGEPESAARHGWLIMFVAGVAGASAMILPGVSGGYLLLVLGVYVPVLGAIDAFKDALKAGDMAAAMTPTMQVIVPVGLGVAAGVLVVSNLVKFVLDRYTQLTLGSLMGLLVGAVVGLWPFQHGEPPMFFTPGAVDVAKAVVLIGVGFMVTSAIARWGQNNGS